jgi:hypothetical protein
MKQIPSRGRRKQEGERKRRKEGEEEDIDKGGKNYLSLRSQHAPTSFSPTLPLSPSSKPTSLSPTVASSMACG